MPYRAPELFNVESFCTVDERVDIWVRSYFSLKISVNRIVHIQLLYFHYRVGGFILG